MTSETTETISVPEAGKRYFGLCRGTSYIAARRGEIPDDSHRPSRQGAGTDA
jgi:hypothetical protein